MALVCKPFGDIITFTRASTATFTGSNGLIQSAAIDAPRFDYNPVTLAAKGLLIEEQRTNLLTYSEQFDDAAWLKNNTTVTANTTTSPDGATTADTVVEGVGAQSQFAVSPANTLPATTSYTLSMYVKRAVGALRGCRLEVGASTDGFQANFDPDTGNVSSQSAYGAATVTSSGSVDVGGGWRRYFVSGVTGPSGTYRLYFRFTSTPTGSTIGYTGDGVQAFNIWGAQLEAGAFPTSYIPTVASQVTRSDDVTYVNTLSPWYNATEGTLYAEYEHASTATNNPAAVSINSNSSASEIVIYGEAAVGEKFFVRSGGVIQANITASTKFASGVYGKLAGAYKVNDFAASANGAAVVTDLSGTVPSGLIRMDIGREYNGTLNLNGHIKRITYYPRRLSNAELVSITT